jgi:uncharacterized protein involved in type VI secretion and phage assembly
MSIADPFDLDELLDEEVPRGIGRWFGVFPAQVTDIKDPDGQGRVKVSLPWAPDGGSARWEAWARLGTLMGGNNRGSWLIPDVGDEVLVAFQAGDPRWPFVLGGLWNGKDKPPEAMDGSGRNALKVIRSRNGVKVTLDDTDGKERFKVETPGGQSIELSDGPGVVEIKDSNGNTVKLDSQGITLTTAAKVTVSASQVDVTAGQVTVNAPMSQFNGVVQAQVVIATSVVGTTYTPGAGNIW